MEVIRFHLDDIPHFDSLCLALGEFDGMHKGHRALVFEASLEEMQRAILLFACPLPSKSKYVLTSLEDKINLLKRDDELDYCLVIEDEIASLSPREFIDKVLSPLGCKKIIVGSDFRFGYQAKGDVALLKEHFEVKEVPFLLTSGKKISTSSIREDLLNGNLDEARFCLGRPYEVVGTSVKGKQMGRKMGFPTLNLSLKAPYVLPKAGVYVCLIYFQGRYFKGMVNVGSNPTFHAGEAKHIEAHLFGYEGEDDYGFTCYVSFLSFIRDEKTFSSIRELEEQLKKDKVVALSYED